MPGVAFIRERERTQQDRAVPSGCCAGLRLTTRGSLLSPWRAVEPLTRSMRTSWLGRSPPMAAMA